MILEQFCIADITAQGVDRLVPRLVHHLEDGRTFGRRRGKKPRSQRVSGKNSGVETSAPGILFDNVGNGSAGKPRGRHRARFVDRPEQRTRHDPSGIQPRSDSLNGASDIAACDRDRATHGLLIGLAAADRDQQSGLRFLDVGHIQCNQLRATKWPAKPSKSNALSRSPDSRSGAVATMLSILAATAGAFLAFAPLKVRQMPRMVALTPSASVGVSSPASL